MIDMLRKLFAPLIDLIVRLIAIVSWRQTSVLTAEDRTKIAEMLKDDYYIILTRRRNYLSTFFISLSNWFLTGRWGYYSHSVMNLEDAVTDEKDFRLVEATSEGIGYRTFDHVFSGVDGVCLLRPANMTRDEWTNALDTAKNQFGKPYDRLYDLVNDQALSCVELVRKVLMSNPNYATDFAEFERTIAKAKNLAPQMFRDCPDFIVELEIKR